MREHGHELRVAPCSPPRQEWEHSTAPHATVKASLAIAPRSRAWAWSHRCAGVDAARVVAPAHPEL